MRTKQFPWPKGWLKHRGLLKQGLTVSTHDCIIFVALFMAAVVLCLALRQVDPGNDTRYVAMVFLLEVFLTAMFTDGYVFSLLAAVLSVLAVDYVFTEPYWHISFLITGFPLTFLVMLIISTATGMVASRAKRVESIAREAERQKAYANLLRSVSHDIRTPLTSIVGATNLLMEQGEALSPEQRQDLMKNANEEAQWLIRVVENMLSITRLGAENAVLEKTEEPAEEIIEGALAKFSHRHPGITTHVEVPRELLMVPMDPLLIQQVLTNILENAVIHGQTTTEITIRLQRKNENWAALSISDNGRGIPPEKLDKLFDGIASSEQKGDDHRNMGIGLSVCRTVMEAHGGKIYAENLPGSGAIFWLELPMKEEEYENQG